MESTEPGHNVLTGSEHEVIRVRQNDLGADGFEIFRIERLHRRPSPHRHEVRGLHITMRSRHDANTCITVDCMFEPGDRIT